MSDKINPKHYTSHQSGIECIEIFRHSTACRAAAIKYLWRCGQKDAVQDELKKALWYVKDELKHNAQAYLSPRQVDSLIEVLGELQKYQDANTHKLFYDIIFGYEPQLKQAISTIEDMINE